MPEQALLLRFANNELPSDRVCKFPMLRSILLVVVLLVIVKFVNDRSKEVRSEQSENI